MKDAFEPGLNRKGITLVELMVALVISAVVIAGLYKVFISQTKSYVVQDQVTEVQQNTRSAMEVLLRDLRMTGFDDDASNELSPPILIANPISAFSDNSITVNYEYYDRDDSTYKKHTVAYWLNNGTLSRKLVVNDDDELIDYAGGEDLLENVDALTLTYGIDQNDDGVVDSWVDAAGVGSIKVIAVRVTLVARPEQTNEDVRKIVAPRALDSIVSMRNLCLK